MGNAPPQKPVPRQFQQQSTSSPHTQKGVSPRVLSVLVKPKLSPLVHLIACREWQSVLARVALFPFETTQQQRMIWYGVEWAVLPLHLACALQPPAKVIQELLLWNSEAAGVMMKRTGRKKRKLLQRPRYSRRSATANTTDSKTTSKDEIQCTNGSVFFSAEADDSLSFSTSGRRHGEHTKQMNWDPDLLLLDSQSFLPLHVACLFRASHHVLSQLIQAYPEGTGTMISSWGMLPLHVLCAQIDIPPPVSPPIGIYQPPQHPRTLPNSLCVLVEANRESAKQRCQLHGMTAGDYLEEAVDIGFFQKKHCRQILAGALEESNGKESVMVFMEEEDSSTGSFKSLEAVSSADGSRVPEEIVFECRAGPPSAPVEASEQKVEESPGNTDPSPRLPSNTSNNPHNHPVLKTSHLSPTSNSSSSNSDDWNCALSLEGAMEWTYGIDLQDELPQLWKRLPLHNACLLGAPTSFVAMLLDVFPDAVNRPDPYSNSLPLHLACQRERESLSVETLEMLLKAEPRTARVVDRKGRLALHYLVMSGGSTEAMEAMLKAFPQGVICQDGYGKTPKDYANKNTDSSVLVIMRRLQSVLARVEDRRKKQDEDGAGAGAVAMN